MDLLFTGVFDNSKPSQGTNFTPKQFYDNVKAIELKQDKKRLEAKTEALGYIQQQVNLQRVQHENYKKLLSEYQQNIKVSEQLRSEILLGIRSGEEFAKLLDKAVKCISEMTGDEAYYKSASLAIKKHL